jgi:type VI secretion system FHA domain protein
VFLTLEIISSNAASMGANARKVFDERGGTIGRREDRDWVINDQGVSSRHAVIRSINGFFFIEDEGSTNGVRVNENLLPVGDPYPLKDGDRIGLDLFDIAVHVTSAAPQVTAGHGVSQPAPAHAFPGSPPGFESSDPYQVAIPAAGGTPGASSVDPLDLLPGDAPKEPPVFPSVDALEHGSPVREHFTPPVVQPPPAPVPSGAPPPMQNLAGPAISEDWDKTVLPARPPAQTSRPGGASPPRPQPGQASRTSREAAPAVDARAADSLRERAAANLHQASSSSVKGLLAGAGIDAQVLTPEVEATLGAILRVVIEGLMEVLRARTEIKNEFRLQQTSFKPRENNPLKFSANVEDALHNLLVKRNPAYLPAVEAFQDAFEDVRLHQVAMLAGVREAYDAMLQEFEPSQLEQKFEGGTRRSGLLGMGGRHKNWELYSQRYQELTRDADDAFRRLFGEEFGRAYEKQLQRLKAARSGKDR